MYSKHFGQTKLGYFYNIKFSYFPHLITAFQSVTKVTFFPQTTGSVWIPYRTQFS